MDIAISLITELGPWGLLALCALLGSSGVVSLVLVLWWQPRLLRFMSEQIAAERMHHANTIKGLGTRMDRMETKIDALAGQWPRLATDPDPGDCA